MAPRYLLEELAVLGQSVEAIRQEKKREMVGKGEKKRKRVSGTGVPLPFVDGTVEVPPLLGLRVVIIHVKDKLEDGPPASKLVLEQLRANEETKRLGCEFVLADAGE